MATTAEQTTSAAEQVEHIQACDKVLKYLLEQARLNKSIYRATSPDDVREIISDGVAGGHFGDVQIMRSHVAWAVSQLAEREPLESAIAHTDPTVTWQPLGSDQAMTVSVSMIREMLCTPTASGQKPEDADVIRFLMLAKSHALNVWAREAYLIGYDKKDKQGKVIGKNFSMVIAQEAYLKRASLAPNYGTKKRGIVFSKDEEIHRREGTIVPPGATLLGGWCEIYSKDGELIESAEVPLSARLQKNWKGEPAGMWATDPGGQICKCAVVEAIRHAFPSTCGMAINTRIGLDELEAAEQVMAKRNEDISGELAAAHSAKQLVEQTPEDVMDDDPPADAPPDTPTREQLADYFSEADDPDKCRDELLENFGQWIDGDIKSAHKTECRKRNEEANKC